MNRMAAAALAGLLILTVGCSKPGATYNRAAYKDPNPLQGVTVDPASGVQGITQLPNGDKAPAPGPSGDTVNITIDQFLKKMKAEKLLIIDVRTPEEYAESHIPGSQLMPLQGLEKDIAKYGKDQELYLVCANGTKSAQAYTKLSNMGYAKLHVVMGGMMAYEKLGGSAVK